MNETCTFCQIVRGELPKTLIEEGSLCLVVLDRNQAARGHLMVISKRHIAQWHELEPSEVAEMAALAHRWAHVIVEALHPDGYNLLMNNGTAAGQDVHHAHLHVTPRTLGDAYYVFGGGIEVLTESDAAALGDELRKHAT